MARAELIDGRQDDNPEIVDQTLEEQPEFTEQTEEQPTAEDDLPEKYKGKSIKQIVQMHQEAEKLLGKHSSEVGELRKVVDDYIQAQSEPAPQKQAEPEEEVDWFVDPDKAVSKAIDSHPSVREAREYAQQARMSSAMSTLQKKHPDMEQVVQDPRFADWIKGSKVRTQLFVQADKDYDVDAADELFSTWKQLNKNANEVATADKATRKQAVKQASTGSRRGSSESRPKKKYRRADIINLMKTDPKRYESLQTEIMAAYREGRVV